MGRVVLWIVSAAIAAVEKRFRDAGRLADITLTASRF
jgi:hypothetical protein